MAQISAAIITNNEEANIGRCLESLEPVADEIIVVDSESTDRAEEICRSFPKVKFVTKKWQGYSKQKQTASDLCQFEYVLSLDADEALSESLREEILKVKPNLDGSTAYEFARLNRYCGRWIRHSGWYPDPQLRLYPKNSCSWNGAIIHERITCGDSISVQCLSGDLLHYSYKSVDDYIKKANAYSTLGAEQVLRDGEGFLILKSLVNPIQRFLKTYFIKLGLLDGYQGLSISLISSFVVFLKYNKAYLLKNQKKESCKSKDSISENERS